MARSPRRRATGATGTAATATVRENLPRPAAAAPSLPREAGKPAPGRRNPFGFLSRLEPPFVGDVIAELRKVTWPTVAETRYLTMVVAIVAVVVGIFLGVLDLGFGWMIEQVFFK
jgi:preprotein translocase subunit SecE